MTPTNDNDAAAWPRNNDGTTTLMRPDSDTTNGTNGDERPTGPPPMTKPHTPQMATTAHRHPPDATTTPRWNDHDTRRDHDTITTCQRIQRNDHNVTHPSPSPSPSLLHPPSFYIPLPISIPPPRLHAPSLYTPLPSSMPLFHPPSIK
ncbi:hypothetical protein K443DRAFT_3496 [Laccaria amethystina LaAM-08-1]|uniref:Uncharacterized protein n=1 Tax=Laccaria amethystina LaAM-08-1 TaxID=1095629 RepID=A0A0C9XLM3_9AGAR|nr:hypothetical protein K443DRAFT_3496 [Laccaria amethystina LaAM-08-1]